MKVLLSAYACDPGRGSEPGAGWAWASAAARSHEVWVLTHGTNEGPVSGALAQDPELAARLHPVYLRAPRWARPLRRRGPSRFLYYLVWQLVSCPRAARRLHQEVGFDVAHHVTYATDWAPVGVNRLRDVPFVWGPVGGSSSTSPRRLRRWMGVRGRLGESARTLCLGASRGLVGRRVAHRACLVLGQNPDVAAAFAPQAVRVEPNVALAAGEDRSVRTTPGTRAVYAGRLVAWKGLALAVAALSRPEAAAWHLDVYGDGPDRRRLERLATRLGVAGRVNFHGHRPRADVLAALDEADVFLFPSTHDAAGWSVAEALSHGCPVVCLDLAGPAVLVEPGDGVVVPAAGDVVAALATALCTARRLRPRRDRWAAARLPDLLDGLYGGLDRPRALSGSPR